MTWPDTLRYGHLPHLQGLQSFSKFKQKTSSKQRAFPWSDFLLLLYLQGKNRSWGKDHSTSWPFFSHLERNSCVKQAKACQNDVGFLSSPIFKVCTKFHILLAESHDYILPTSVIFWETLAIMLHCHRWARRGETNLKQMRDHCKKNPRQIVKTKPTWIFGTRAFWVNTLETTSDVMGCPAQVTTADIHQRIDSSGFHQPCDVLQVQTGLQ